MPLPQGYNSKNHLVSVLSRVHNRIVKADFRDVGDDDWESSISTDRESLRTACTVRANDSLDIIISRLILYYIILRRAQDLQIPYFGDSKSYVSRRNRPKVSLYFLADGLDVPRHKSATEGVISFRLMNETATSMTRSKIEAVANRIKNSFGGSGYVWQKGKKLVSYTDWDFGLQMQILCRSASDAESLIRAVINVQNATSFDRENMNLVESQAESSRYPETPRREVILGDSVELSVERPNANVRFRYAWMTLPGLAKPINLYDRGVTLTNCVVR